MLTKILAFFGCLVRKNYENLLETKLKKYKNIIASESDVFSYLPWYIRWTASIITSTSKIPNHIAFIMDGNRRYARKRDQEVIKGHFAGFDKLRYVILWCRALKIKEISLYAFSLENYKRPREEVQGLLDLFYEKLLAIQDDLHLSNKHKVRARIVGDLDTLPSKHRALVDKIHSTQDESIHYECTLNVCIAYWQKFKKIYILKLSSYFIHWEMKIMLRYCFGVNNSFSSSFLDCFLCLLFD